MNAVLGTFEPPLFTCDAVVSEACFLLRAFPGGTEAVPSLLAEGIVRADFRPAAEGDGAGA